MNTKNFVDAVKQCSLPFVYYGEQLNDEKCQKALKKIGVDTNVLAVIVSDGLIGAEGIAVLEDGIKFSLSSGSTGDMKIPKTKGEFRDQFIIHDIVSVKKPLLPRLDVTMLVWDSFKKKPFYFNFSLTADNVTLEEATAEELKKLLVTLIEKTGTEYDSSAEQEKAKKPNEFDFIWGIPNVTPVTHTIITVNDDNITIRKMKIDGKTNIQTPKGKLITISRSAVGSVKIRRSFSVIPLLAGLVFGAFLGFFIATLIMLSLGIICGLIFSFPKTLFIYRKDGTKYKTVVRGGEEEYERLFNFLFK
jgi:hypothetical protein